MLGALHAVFHSRPYTDRFSLKLIYKDPSPRISLSQLPPIYSFHLSDNGSITLADIKVL